MVAKAAIIAHLNAFCTEHGLAIYENCSRHLNLELGMAGITQHVNRLLSNSTSLFTTATTTTASSSSSSSITVVVVAVVVVIIIIKNFD